MALSKKEAAEAYPLPAYNFRVAIDGAAMSFAEVSGISLEYETVTYRHGFSAWEGERIEKFRYDRYIPVTLKKGTVRGGDDLFRWLEETNGSRTVEISLCDEVGEPVVTWRIRRALAVKLEAPAFDAATNEVSIESLELQAGGITVEHH